jgi:hypothetical protein
VADDGDSWGNTTAQLRGLSSHKELTNGGRSGQRVQQQLTSRQRKKQWEGESCSRRALLQLEEREREESCHLLANMRC